MCANTDKVVGVGVITQASPVLASVGDTLPAKIIESLEEVLEAMLTILLLTEPSVIAILPDKEIIGVENISQ